MDGITLVVANDRETVAEVAEATEALAAELVTDEDEVLWVDRAGLKPSLDGVSYLLGPAGGGRGHLYALGLRHASREVVAFTDSTTVLVPGWRRAVVAAFDRGAVVAGGPVLPSGWPTRRAWACFLAEYGFHAVAPHTSSAGDVSANNVAYSRAALTGVNGALWKSEVDRSLMDRGIHPAMVPEMRVVVTKSYPWKWLLSERIRQGALFASQRCLGWRWPRRVGYAVATVLLPVLLFTRLAARVRGDRDLRSRFWGSAPFVLLAMVTWSAGEALGALGWKDRNVGPF